MKPLLLFLFLVLPALAQQEGTKEYPPPEPNRPWLHAKTGLRFPNEIADMVCEGITDFVDDPALGQSLRYVNRELRVRADVYVFPCPHPLGTPAEVKEAAREEAGHVLAGLEQMKQRGHYSEIEQNKASYAEMDLYPQGSGKTGWLDFSVNATIHEDAGAGKTEQRVFSYAGITTYKGHFVKIRCTVPAEGNEEVEKQISQFVTGVRFLVFLEPGLRTEAKEHIRTYRTDPLSANARDAAGGVVVYAEKTPTFSFTVSSKVTALGASLTPAVTEADSDIMRAFFIGVVDAALQEPAPKELDLEQGGAEEIVRVYEILRKEYPKVQNAEIDALAKATKAGKGGEWLREDKAR
jgi:hypothetical protein